MSVVRVHVATCNTPQGHRDKIRHSAHARVLFLADLANHLGIQAIGLQETGPLLAVQWRLRALWTYFGAAAVTLGRGGRRTGNGAVVRTGGGDGLEVVHRRGIKVPVNWNPRLRIPATLRRRATFLALLVREPETGALLVLLVVHLPILRYLTTAAERLRINAELIAYAKRLRALNLPVVPLGDFNAGDRSEELRAWLRNGFVLGASNGADHILGGGVTFTGAQVDTSVHGTVTDHRGMPHAVALVPVPNTPLTVRKLPKV